MNYLNNFSVLILDESTTIQKLFSEWITGVATKSISSPSEIQDEFDSTVVAVCLSESAFDGGSKEAQKYILNRNPYCQIIGLLPRNSFITPYEDRFDDVLQRPVYKDEFREAIEHRFVSGVYSQLLREFYDVNSKLLSLRRASDKDIEGRKDEISYVQKRNEVLGNQLNELQEQLSSDTILDILQTIERHKEFLSKPDIDEEDGQGTKFRPKRCPSCRLPWGVDHRNEFDAGYEVLGADVYQCARCDKIVHGLAGEQRVL